MRIAIYIRVSTDEQAEEGFSLAAQERICRDYCTQRGWADPVVYVDDGYSGRTAKRPGFQQLLAEVRAGRVQAVVIHRFNRLARNTRLLINTLGDWEERRIIFVSIHEQIDFSTPIGKVIATILAALAQFESDNLSFEVRKGLLEKLKQGGHIGPVPLGYTRDPSGQLLPSDDVETVRLIYRLYATGDESDLTIAEQLNARGLMTLHKGKRRPFQKDSVKSILINPVYIGLLSYKGGEPHRGRHVAIVERGLWDQCQEVRARRSRQRGGRLPVRGLGGLLSELVFCGHCGARMHTQMCGQGASRQRYYRCSRRRKFGSSACDAPFVPAAQIEPIILDVLRSLSIISTLRDAVLAEVQRRIARPALATPSIRALTGQLERLKDMYQMGDLARDEYIRRRGVIEQQIAQTAPTPAVVLDTERAIAFLSDMGVLVDSATEGQHRALVQQLFIAIWIEKGAVTAIRPAPIYALLVESIARMWSKRSRLGSNQRLKQELPSWCSGADTGSATEPPSA